MKVASKWSSGFRAIVTVVTGAAVGLAVLAGTGFVPSQSAWAQITGQGANAELQLAPAEARNKAEVILEPSGLHAVETEMVTTRTPTRVSRLSYQSVPESAPSADGWRSARASTYGIGDGLVGEGMANGDVLQADSMVVAHKSLPFGTQIEFRYNGLTCIATVCDRGPYITGRVFDLGPGTANALGFDGVHTLEYRIL